MTTVSRIISLALKDAGVIGEGETASAETLLDAFDTLKMMVAQWQVDNLFIYAQTTISFAATGAQSYTLGTGGDVATTRPSEIAGAFWRNGSEDYPLEVINSFEQYQNIGIKSISGTPDLVCYDPTYSLGTLYIWPQPSTGTLFLTVSNPLPTYTSVTDDLSVPAEYEAALRYSLAELCPAVFQVAPRPDIAAFAKRARTIVKRNNAHIPELGMPMAVRRNRYFDIKSGR